MSSTLRRLAALVAPIAVVSTILATAGTAQAAPTPSAQPHSAGGVSADPHYRPAGCATLSAAEQASKIPVARCYAVAVADASGKVEVRSDAPPSTALTPTDLRDAYRLPDGGAGMTVAIVDAYGYAHAESDLAVFRSYYGLPACTTENGCFRKVDQSGGTNYPAEDGGWSVETALDLDAVSSVCPKCHLLLVEGDTPDASDLGEAAQTAAELGASVISNSYGVYGGFPSEQQLDSYYDHPGIAVVAATGDVGNLTSWPAEGDHVVAVGGTTLTRDTGTARGWDEVPWRDGGSGCSQYEPRPDYQADLATNCPNGRAIADIAANAGHGLAVYNTSGESGWSSWGGTSLAAPLIAGMYALAGPIAPNTYPVTYPYRADASGLNDITSGTNGSCGNVLCQAGPGWDGPTGLGTPNGVTALTMGEHGDIAGVVTDAATGGPISGATVTVVDGKGTTYSATTDATGKYDLAVPTGSYDVTVTKYGYASKTASGVTVNVDQTVPTNFALTPQSTDTVSGVVTDGSGHGWPMYAKITIDGYPGGALYTDPYTGHYSVKLAAGSSYTMHVSSVELPGYLDQDVKVDLTGGSGGTGTTSGAAAVSVGGTPHANHGPSPAATAGVSVHDVALKVDPTTCSAPGYAYADVGTSTSFTGWSDATPQDGWTVTDDAGTGQTWRFENLSGWDPPVGGDESFADIDSEYYGEGGRQDSSLVSPVVDLSGQAHPEIGYNTTYILSGKQTAQVDLSLDGGTTWSTVYDQDHGLQLREDIPIPQAAGKSNVRVRFHYTGNWSRRWEIDDVLIGTRSCAPQHGGLVAGIVKDGNTKAPLNGATVTSDADSAQLGVTMATPDDANLSDGYYWLFSSHTGKTRFTLTDGRYSTRHGSADVRADAVLHRNWTLGAGHLTVTPSAVARTEELGATKSRTVTFHNDGTAPLSVRLSEEDDGFTAMNGTHQTTAPGAPVKLVHAKATYAAAPNGPVARPAASQARVDGRAIALRQASPAAGPWTDIADYPTQVMDDSVAYHDGKVYVVGGTEGSYNLNDVNAYDPATQSWTALAKLPEPLNGPVAGFVGDTLYVVGGWNISHATSRHAYAYDTGTNTWSRIADLPSGVAMAGVAVVGGQLYVIGGCTTGGCAPAGQSVYSYNPDSGSWTAQPDYPTPVAYVACGGAGGEVICAGGVNPATGSTTSTYAYPPGAKAWQQRADLPVDAWGASASAANGTLQVVGGVIHNGADVTNQAFDYDPATDEWTPLPNANNAQYRGGGACGLYQVGGSAGGFSTTPFAQTLPGYASCNGDTDLPWLRENRTAFTVAPGASVTVRVSMDSSAATQPGDYAGTLDISTDTPYATAPVSVAMHVTPPKTWGKLAGTVTSSSGAALVGATVELCAMYNTKTGTCGPQTFTLKTDAHGNFQLWLNKGYSPLEVIAAMQGYQPQMKLARIHRGETTTVRFALAKI